MTDKEGNYIRQIDQMSDFRSQMYHSEIKIVLKIIAQVKDNYRLQVYNKNNEALIKYDKDYTGIHTLVFENLLEEGMRSSAAILPFIDWLGTCKAWRGKWKLVDMDNYLNGNDYFSGYVSQAEYKEKLAYAKKEEENEKTEDPHAHEIMEQLFAELEKDRAAAVARIEKRYPKLSIKITPEVVNPEEAEETQNLAKKMKKNEQNSLDEDSKPWSEVKFRGIQ
jgi:hypothetical protein